MGENDVSCSLNHFFIHSIPEELRRRRQGRRAGAKVKARLAAKRWKYKPLVPSIIMGNVNCLTNKTEELAALVKTDRTIMWMYLDSPR